MSKILSVSVAAYNVEKYLEECLNSFISPNVINDIEVIVVNDGSKDATLSIAKEYEQKYPDIFRVVDKENGGWGSTLNSAIQSATGKYFKQLDGDDYYDNNHLGDFLESLSRTNADIVVTPYVEFDNQTRNIIRTIEENKSIERNKEWDVRDIEEQLGLAMHAITVKTELLRKYDITITEQCFYTDTEFLIKTFDRAVSIMLLDDAIYWYRLGNAGQSVSMEGYIKHFQDMIMVSNTMLVFEKNAQDRKNKVVSHNWIKRHIKNTYRVLWKAVERDDIRNALIKYDKNLVECYGLYSSLAPRAIKLWRKFGYHGYGIFKTISKLHNNT